jgi:hypothetical protein
MRVLKQKCGPAANTHPKKRKEENKMETEADQLNKGDPQPLRPTGKYHHAPYNESSSTKQHLKEGKRQSCCPDRRLVLGFPTTQEGKWIKGSHDALQEGMVPPESGTVSMSVKTTRILPEKTYPQPLGDQLHRSPARSRSRHHQTRCPRPCTTTVTKSPSLSHQGYGREACKIVVESRLNRGQEHYKRAGGNCLHRQMW